MTDNTAPEEHSRDASREPLNDMEDGSVPASLPTADPAETLSRLLNGYQATQALHVAARLGIVDVLQDGPKTAQVLADRVGAHEPSLRRFLGFLTTLGLLTHDSEGHFAATPVGALLRADHPESERPWALLLGAPPIWQPWGELYEAVVSGRPAFERVYGERFFTYLGHNPEQAALFNAAMSSDSANVADILDAYDFSGSHNHCRCRRGARRAAARHPRAGAAGQRHPLRPAGRLGRGRGGSGGEGGGANGQVRARGWRHVPVRACWGRCLRAQAHRP